LGKYIVHAYAKLPNGTLVALGGNSFEVKAPKIGDIVVSNERKSQGEFQVKITGIENGELIRKIQIPIWSESNQGDIIWYNATKNLDGEYVVNVNISQHKNNVGIYNIHVYLTDVTGTMRIVGTAVCNMQPEYVSMEAVDIDGTESYYQADLVGLVVPGSVKEVRYAVWGQASGQNDLRWYTAQKVAEGNFTHTVKILNHKELGIYNVHAYAVTANGKMVFIGKTNFEVNSKPSVASIQVTEIDGNKGTFNVDITGMMGPSGIEMVQVPIWCNADQSDIKWYTALKTSDNIYTVTMDVANHAYHFGDYKIHVYTTMGNGNMVYVGGTAATIEAKEYTYSRYISPTCKEVGIKGVTASRVQFPTWSETNGQDDIVWYEGVNDNNGNWSVTVSSGKHKHGGAYITDIYVTDENGMRNEGRLKYALEDDRAARIRSYKGVPYVYGGTTPNGWDCSGCVQWLYANIWAGYSKINMGSGECGICCQYQ